MEEAETWSPVPQTSEVLHGNTLGTTFKQQAQNFGLQEPLGVGDPSSWPVSVRLVTTPHGNVARLALPVVCRNVVLTQFP